MTTNNTLHRVTIVVDESDAPALSMWEEESIDEASRMEGFVLTLIIAAITFTALYVVFNAITGV